jgi:hypothetical protein
VAEAVRVLAPKAATNGYTYDDVVSIVQAYERIGNSVGVDWFWRLPKWPMRRAL